MKKLYQHIEKELEVIRGAGTFKSERVIQSPQGSVIRVSDGQPVRNFCANNYLGLAQHPELAGAAIDAIRNRGYGMASVRFICGTQDIHRELEQGLSDFLQTEDTILYSSCFDANGGLFETLLGPEDAIISDELNHASIIDGIRLCKSRRFRYGNNRMDELELRLREAADARFRMIATDGVFSMDGTYANLPAICELADCYDALVMVDDSHAVGFAGSGGRGTPELQGVADRVDVLTGTLGKALGGASGGYVSGRASLVALLRQRSRPYLFSNTLAPGIVGGSLKALELITRSPELRERLVTNTARFRKGLAKLGFTVTGETHPICPIMLGDAALAARMAELMLDRGVYVIGFSFPVVPRGKARIRAQISAAHTAEDIDFALDAFAQAGRELGVIQDVA